MIWQIIFFVVVISVEVGLAAACMLLSEYVLAHLHLPNFWKALLGFSLTAVFIGLIVAPIMYLQAKYQNYRQRKNASRK